MTTARSGTAKKVNHGRADPYLAVQLNFLVCNFPCLHTLWLIPDTNLVYTAMLFDTKNVCDRFAVTSDVGD